MFSTKKKLDNSITSIASRQKIRDAYRLLSKSRGSYSKEHEEIPNNNLENNGQPEN